MTHPHIVDIDQLVLIGLDRRRNAVLHTAIEAAVLHALGGSGIDMGQPTPGLGAPVAREVATSVVKAVDGAVR
jgi:hypothetical protein